MRCICMTGMALLSKLQASRAPRLRGHNSLYHVAVAYVKWRLPASRLTSP
jgi:hypothetical protein